MRCNQIAAIAAYIVEVGNRLGHSPWRAIRMKIKQDAAVCARPKLPPVLVGNRLACSACARLKQNTKQQKDSLDLNIRAVFSIIDIDISSDYAERASPFPTSNKVAACAAVCAAAAAAVSAHAVGAYENAPRG